MANNKLIEGKIQSITNNSIKINNYYIKFFDLKYLEGIKVGDEVGISYKENMKDNKLYRNGVSIVKYEPKLTNVNSETKEKLDTTTVNTILMTAKEIYLQSLTRDESFEEIVKNILKGLKLIQLYSF